jgi:hypothetical protein
MHQALHISITRAPHIFTDGLLSLFGIMTGLFDRTAWPWGGAGAADKEDVW